MATNSAKTRSHFGHTLRQILDENQAAGRKPDSIRGVARRMANGQPEKIEVAKRSLFKWIAGTTRPSSASRSLVAVAVERDPSVFAEDDDEEEDAEMRDLFRALMTRIDRVVEERVDERLKELA